jgi:hypothetical protein
MRSETESDKSADSVEPIGSEHKQEFHQLSDSTEAPLQWHSATNTELVESIQYLSKLLNHSVSMYGKELEKQFKSLKRFQ